MKRFFLLLTSATLAVCGCKDIHEPEDAKKTDITLTIGHVRSTPESITLTLSAKGEDLANSAALQAEKGNAILGEVGYSHGGFSFMGTFRQLEHMGTHISVYNMGINNTMNYLPALTRQYTYMLANLNPYQVNVEGELGGQGTMNVNSWAPDHKTFAFVTYEFVD